MPKQDSTEILTNWPKTKNTITVLELQKLLKEPDYTSFHRLVTDFLTEGKLIPVKASGQNGRMPSLPNKYRIVKAEEDYTDCLEQIRRLEPILNIAAYLQRPEYYTRHQEILEGLSRYLWYSPALLKQPMSRKERSFSIWGKEKLIDEQLSLIREVLKFNGLAENFLNYYDTPEPFFEYVHKNSVPMTLVVIENKDTWFTLRRLMQETGKHNLAGSVINAIIYGEGNKITKPNALENYVKEMYSKETSIESRFLYFGDLDNEGIGMYYRTQRANPNLSIQPFTDLYLKMLHMAENRELPISHDGRQIHTDMNEFEKLLELSPTENKLDFLRQGRYIPQEILNCQVLAEMLE